MFRAIFPLVETVRSAWGSRSRLTLVVVMLLGASLRVAWMATQTPVISSDGAEYARMAEHLLADHALIGNFEGPEILYAPLYPALIAATMPLSGNSERAAHLVSLLAGTLLIAIIYLLAERVYDRRTACTCAVLTAVHPLLIALSASAYNETLYLTVWAGVAYQGVRVLDEPRARNFLLLGAWLAFAYLTRVEAVALAPLLMAALLVAGFMHKAVRASLRGIAIACATFVLIASPYVGFFYDHTGSVRLEAKWNINYTMARNRIAGMSGVESDYGLSRDLALEGPLLSPYTFVDYSPYPHGLRDKLNAFTSMARRSAPAVYQELMAADIGSPIMLVLVILGLTRQPWSKRRSMHEALLLAMAAFVVFIVLTSATTEFRYLFPIVPLLIPWAGKGLREWGEWIRGFEALSGPREAQRKWFAAGSQALIVALTIIVSFEGVRRDYLFTSLRSEAAVAARDAALWLSAYQPGSKRIAVVPAVIPYYAKGTLLTLPYADAQATLRYFAQKNVDFVVLDSEEAQAFPTIAAWLVHGIPDRHARLVYETATSRGERLAIYQWEHDNVL